ncbi:IclR family transcriptional regulator [Mesorhizobium sp. BAC0120]|uniref:IclR family transcriptional regulator n=1 Tax=Mesorhizobium sp. BAC0120 TaxID=3090670 RepID=UPI00298C2143|nr:IclR family transcriptional regulator [Mesorhizobium sp. BAC0120]MDW6022929.1 IclR family transcriptional regulator [Mesorhizobium sp. BAC0120]
MPKKTSTTTARPAKTPSAAETKQAYGAPALEKGLDVLELLAGMSRGVTQSEIAQLLGRSLQEVYRVVMVLERRGFIQRRPGDDGLFLSNRLHDLSNRYPPMRRMLDIALPIMTSASVEAYQAMHIAVLDHLDIRVVAQVDSPAPLGFRLRVGTQNPAAATASGRVLIAFQRPAIKDWAFQQIERTVSQDTAKALEQRIEAIHRRGYEMIAGEGLQGITDVSFPILDSEGHAMAALTMPYLPSAKERVSFDDACRALFDAASAVTQAFDGTLPAPNFPLAPIREKRPPARPT